MTDKEVASIQSYTKGPWYWRKMGDNLSLVAAHSGTLIVMDFVRKGFNSAEPRFGIRRDNMGGLMVKATKLEEDGIDHPDARLIAASPDLFVAAQEALRVLDEISPGDHRKMTALSLLRAAIASAEPIALHATAP